MYIHTHMLDTQDQKEIQGQEEMMDQKEIQDQMEQMVGMDPRETLAQKVCTLKVWFCL